MIIGGTEPGAGNLVGGNGQESNGDGVMIMGSSGIVVQGNLIGTDRTGTLNLGNGACGIEVIGNSDHVTIGGTTAGAGNVVAFNGFGAYGGAGIEVYSGRCVTVLGNVTYGNHGLGIDLGELGRTPNDPLDTDSGGNDLLNFPVLGTARMSGGRLQVAGPYDGLPNATITLHFYAGTAIDPAWGADTRQYLGQMTITTDGNGHADYVFMTRTSLAAGTGVSATATDASGNTSEFSDSLAVTVVDTNPPRVPIGDYDGDGKTDLGVYMPVSGTSFFVYQPSSGGTPVAKAFGRAGPGIVPLYGDYDGDGKTDVGVYMPVNGTGFFVYQPSSGGTPIAKAFGGTGNGIRPLASIVGSNASALAAVAARPLTVLPSTNGAVTAPTTSPVTRVTSQPTTSVATIAAPVRRPRPPQGPGTSFRLGRRTLAL